MFISVYINNINNHTLNERKNRIRTSKLETTYRKDRKSTYNYRASNKNCSNEDGIRFKPDPGNAEEEEIIIIMLDLD